MNKVNIPISIGTWYEFDFGDFNNQVNTLIKNRLFSKYSGVKEKYDFVSRFMNNQSKLYQFWSTYNVILTKNYNYENAKIDFVKHAIGDCSDDDLKKFGNMAGDDSIKEIYVFKQFDKYLDYVYNKIKSFDVFEDMDIEDIK